MNIKTTLYSLIFLASYLTTVAQQNGCIDGNCVDGWGVYKFDEGTKYTGYWKNSKRSGFGYDEFSSGVNTIGYYSKNACTKGYYIDYTGTKGIYYGQFINGKFNGYGLRIPGDKSFSLEGNVFKEGKYSEGGNEKIDRNKSTVQQKYTDLVYDAEKLKNLIASNAIKDEECNAIKTPLDLQSVEKDGLKDESLADVKMNYFIIPYKFGFIMPGTHGFISFYKNFEKYNRFDTGDPSSGAAKDISEVQSNLFTSDGYFIQNGEYSSQSLNFIDYSFTYVRDQDPVVRTLDRKSVGDEVEINSNEKVYTFKYDKILYTGNSVDKYYIRASKGTATHDHSTALIITRINFQENTYNYLKAISVDNILGSFKTGAALKSFYYTNDLNYKGYDWNLNKIFLLKNKQIAVIVDLIEKYERNDSRFNFPIPQEFKKSLILIFDAYGKELLNYSKIVTADRYIPSLDNGYYAIINDGAYVLKYDLKGNILWKNVFGLSKEKGAGNDLVTCFAQTQNKFYLGGASQSKYHIGKFDPIIFEIDSKTGLISKEKLEKDNVGEKIQNIFTCNDSVYFTLANYINKLY